jgi:hypothetical protein
MKNSRNCQICIHNFFSVHIAKYIEGKLKICISNLVYSQIWLNLLKDDRHFGYKQKIPAKNIGVGQISIFFKYPTGQGL